MFKEQDSRFEVVHSESEGLMGPTAMIILDTITGVQYMFVHDGHAGGLTPLLGADGQPLVRTVLDDDEE